MIESNDNNLKPEQSWLKAEKMLDGHFRKKRIVIWFLSVFISVLLIVGSVLIGHFSVNDVEEKTMATKQSPANSSEEKNILPANHDEHRAAPETGKSTGSEMNKRSKEKINTDSKTLTASNKNNFEPGRKSGPFVGKENTAIPAKRDEGIRKTSNEIKVSIPVVKSKEIKSSSENPVQNISKEVVNADSNSEVEATDLNNSGIDNISTDHNTKTSQVANPEVASIKPFHPGQIQFTVPENSVVVSQNLTNNITFPENKFNLRLTVYGSASYVFKTLKSKEFSAYINRRKKEEEGIVTTSFGAALSHELKDFTVSLGIEYSAWGEQNMYLPYLNKKNTVENGGFQHYYRTDTATVFNFGVISYVPQTPVWDSTFVSHSETVIQSTFDPSVYSANSINRFYFFEVPVELSYRFTHTRIGIGATAGISPAWIVGKKGYYLKRDMGGMELISEIESVNSFIMNGRFSIDFYYKMNAKINVVLRPQIKSTLNSVFKSDYDVTQRYYSTGLVFGLQYKLVH